jgi:hypothetical protein
MPQAGAAAVLLAAIACEIRVKEVLRNTAGERVDAVELLISRAKEFSGSARDMFSKVMFAANGRSLKEEDSELEKAVGALFEGRNAIAHRGEIPATKAVLTSIETASRVLSWLDGIAASALRDDETAAT